jgi:hypothetical protein
MQAGKTTVREKVFAVSGMASAFPGVGMHPLLNL